MENLNWNLGLIYKDRNEWTNDLEKINNMINELAAYKDKLNDKASFKEFLIKKTNQLRYALQQYLQLLQRFDVVKLHSLVQSQMMTRT